MYSVVVVDDEREMRDFLSILLKKEGHGVQVFAGGQEALGYLSARGCDLVISDIRMPGMPGLELLEHVKAGHSEIPVVLITAFTSPDDAVQAMRGGAFDYISKPFNVDEIKSVLAVATSRKEPAPSPPGLFSGIIGGSHEMQKRGRARRDAPIMS